MPVSFLYLDRCLHLRCWLSSLGSRCRSQWHRPSLLLLRHPGCADRVQQYYHHNVPLSLCVQGYPGLARLSRTGLDSSLAAGRHHTGALGVYVAPATGNSLVSQASQLIAEFGEIWMYSRSILSCQIWLGIHSVEKYYHLGLVVQGL